MSETNLSKRRLAAIPFALFLMALGFYWLGPENTISDAQKEELSIAVLPFLDRSPKKNQEYFGDGIAEEILNSLAQLKELKVASRTSSFFFKNKELTITEIGKALRVNYVLEGSVQKQGDKIRITAQLIKVEDGYHLWSHKYDQDFKDIFAIQDEIARKTGEILLKKLAPEQLSKIKIRTAQNSKAYDLFLKAKHIHLNRYYGNFNINDFKLSEELFFKAIQLDSGYALAYAGLADLYDTHKDALLDTSELRHYEFLKIKNSELAWQLNPNLPYVNIVRGWIMRNKKVETADLDAAFKNFLKGYQLNPTSSDGLFGLAFLYEDKSLLTDANKILDRVIELEPLRSANYSTKGDFLMRAGKFEIAINNNLAALQVNPTDLLALGQLAMNYTFLNKRKKALATYEQIQKIDPSYLNKSIINKKMYALVKGEIETARKIPTSHIDYRGENVIINSLIGEVDYLETSFLKWWEWWKRFKGKKVFSQSSAYLELLKNPIYDKLRNKPFFQKILQSEKEKYDHFYASFPRAEEILVKSVTALLNDRKKVNSNLVTLRYKLYFLLVIISGFSFYLFYRNQQQKAAFLIRLNKLVNIPQIFQKKYSSQLINNNNQNGNGEVKKDSLIKKIQELIVENLTEEDFSVNELARSLHLSRSQVHRKIKALTGMSTSIYIRFIRLEKAKELLKSDELTISEIAYTVGFKSPVYFSQVFKETYGESPSSLRN